MVKEMTAVQRALAAIHGKEVDHVPSANGLVTTTLEMMDKCNVTYPKIHYDPQMMATLVAAPYEMCGIEGTTLPFDISLEAEVLGAELDWKKADRPPIKGHPVKDPNDFTIPENIGEKGRIPVVLKAIEILKEKYGEDLVILPTTVCPFTLAGHLARVDELVMWILSDPDKVHTLVGKVADFVIEYQKLLKDHGADIIFEVDPTASGDLISGDMFHEFVVPALSRISKKAPAQRVLHICGNTKSHLPFIAETGVLGFSFDKAVPIWYARQVFGGKVATYGNLDVIELFTRKTPQDVYNAAQECIRQGVNVVGTACDIPETTSLENIQAYARACRETPVPTQSEIDEYNKKFEQ